MWIAHRSRISQMRSWRRPLTYRCQDTPSGVLSFKLKYAEIRLEVYYSLFSFRKTATDSARFYGHAVGMKVSRFISRRNARIPLIFHGIVENLAFRHLWVKIRKSLRIVQSENPWEKRPSAMTEIKLSLVEACIQWKFKWILTVLVFMDVVTLRLSIQKNDVFSESSEKNLPSSRKKSLNFLSHTIFRRISCP